MLRGFLLSAGFAPSRVILVCLFWTVIWKQVSAVVFAVSFPILELVDLAQFLQTSRLRVETLFFYN
jgi:hypothetical protein